MTDFVLDSIDLDILRCLQENARLTTKELAARVNLSTTPVFERLKRLERSGFIKKYMRQNSGKSCTVCGWKIKSLLC